MNPKVDAYLSKATKWQKELKKLRSIILTTPLTEELKWGQPCYTWQKNNVVIIGELKDYCTIGFFKGVLLKDPENILDKPGENTQSARLIRFTTVQQIADIASTLKEYIHEAIEVEKAGLKVNFKKSDEHTIPEEFQKTLAKNPALKKAFYTLTPGRQRAYLLYFSAPKQSKTRESRIQKCTPQILSGNGLNEI